MLSVKMGSNSKVNVFRIKSITEEDEIGIKLVSKETRVVKDLVSDIILLVQLYNKGWKLFINSLKDENIIQVKNNNQFLIFYERQKKNLCHLSIKNVES